MRSHPLNRTELYADCTLGIVKLQKSSSLNIEIYLTKLRKMGENFFKGDL